jgi:hypothetical protein
VGSNLPNSSLRSFVCGGLCASACRGGRERFLAHCHWAGMQIYQWLGKEISTSVSPTTHAQSATYTTTHQIHTCLNSTHLTRGNTQEYDNSLASHIFSLLSMCTHINTMKRNTQYCCCSRKRAIKAQDITSLLCQAVRLIGSDVGLCGDNVSAHSLRAGGAMALLCAQVDDNIIKLISC